MLLSERQILESRIQHERGVLDAMPPHFVIDRFSIESEIEELEEKLAALPPEAEKPVSTRITFRGPCVASRHGIATVFGTKAIQKYMEAVEAIGKKLPGKRQTREGQSVFDTIITRTVAGSFGFELEASPLSQATMLPDHSLLDMAFEKMDEILLASSLSDDALAEKISDTNKPTVRAIYGFVKFLAENRCTCNIEFRGRTYSLTNVQQSEARLVEENVTMEDVMFLEGVYRGILPGKSDFELRVSDEKGKTKEIFGKISSEIDTDEINTWNGRFNMQQVRIKVSKTIVGNGKPSYVILEPPAIVEETS